VLFQAGQRWASQTEPELGIGLVQRVEQRLVVVRFEAGDETRHYALETHPLRRVEFRPKDTIKTRDGVVLTVRAVLQRGGLFIYRCDDRDVPESALCDTLNVDRPDLRLAAGQVDKSRVWELRWRALQHQHARRQSTVRGLAGARMELLPHQLYVALEVSGRLAPRVLLSDEVGLGKTIEACLILHRLLQTGRVRRALILVPEPLIHQWFVELLRRFNLWFHIFDEERCEAIESGEPASNPFLDDQCVLCAVSWLAASPRRAAQVVDAGWDILIVDEAHHLRWTEECASPEYRLVERLGSQTRALLLLTATPEQLGLPAHFARLRLLDPARYAGLELFLEETAHYQEVAAGAARLAQHQPLDLGHASALARILGEPLSAVQSQFEQAARGNLEVRDELLSELLDRHGTGRVMFRNTRAKIAGFPSRIPRLAPLEAPAGDARLLDRLADEFAADLDPAAEPAYQPELAADPRILWLVGLLRRLAGQKVLLLCRTRAKVEAIDQALRTRINASVALFHEGLSLLQRDRNAAWFAEEDGASLLVCSEIGSEGRNFQFAHHLVLFDLPLDPELLEQRIGRLDRIGQRREIQIHVPFVVGSSQEVLVRWHAEGLDALANHLRGGHALLERLGARVRNLARDFHETLPESRADLERLIGETGQARMTIAAQLEAGHDLLLEMSSFRSDVADAVLRAIRQADAARSIDGFLMDTLDHYGIPMEELGSRTYRLGSAGVFADSFPGLPEGGILVTCDRARALSREDIQFLTWDHPLATGALDLLLGSPAGNSAFVLWEDSRRSGLFLEAICVLECIAPVELHLDRFLPPTPLRVVVDYQGADVTAGFDAEGRGKTFVDGDIFSLLDEPGFRGVLLPRCMEASIQCLQERVPAMIQLARAAMARRLDPEIERLKRLRAVNPNVREAEILELRAERDALDRQLQQARLRLDAVRLIRRGPR